jgi:hypothetical protein
VFLLLLLLLGSSHRKPKPLHSVMNLTTSVSKLQFNHDSQILSLSSAEEANAFKLVGVCFVCGPLLLFVGVFL